MRALASIVVALVVALQPCLVAAAPADASSDADVVLGMKQVDDGEYDAAIFTLDAASRRLSGDPKRVSDLSQAYLYLGIAYLGKGHQAAAHAKFREAVEQIRDISLSPDRFPPKVIDALEAARAEVRQASPATAVRPATSASGPAPKKGGSKTLLVVGGVAAIGGGAALALGGGGSSNGGPSTPIDNRRTETFNGTLCGDYDVCGEYGRGYDIVVTTAGTLDATLTWGNSGIFFQMSLDDDSYQTVAQSNRTTNTTSTLTASVTPRTSSPSAAYHIYVSRGDGGAVADNFTLTVRHP